MKQSHFKFQGQFLTLSEIGRRTGMHAATLSYRVHDMGMSIEQAVARPITPYGQRHGDGRQPRLYLFRRKMRSVADIADMLGVSVSAVYRRRSGDRILEAPETKDPNPSYQDAPSHARLITFRGRTNTIAGWARERGIHKETIRSRLRQAWPVKYALTIPAHVGGFDTITYQGRTMTIGAWAKEVGIKPHTLRARLDRYGWDVAKALYVQPPKTYTYRGRSLTLNQWANFTGIKLTTLRERIVQHRWPIERALTEPVNHTFTRKSVRPTTATNTGGTPQTSIKLTGTGEGRRETHLEGKSA